MPVGAESLESGEGKAGGNGGRQRVAADPGCWGWLGPCWEAEGAAPQNQLPVTPVRMSVV